MSDLHLEWHRDQGRSFVESLSVAGEVLVLAGDICGFSQIEETLYRFSEKGWDHIVYVPGNHESYGSSIQNVRTICARVNASVEGVHALDNSSVKLNGKTFHGATLWFSESPGTHKGLNDFRIIHNFEPMVYQENKDTIEYFLDNVKEGDIVVTHHTPSYLSATPKFKTHPMNPWFHNKLDSMMKDLKPSVWIHGHTHSSLDYMLDKTRVLCNALGYPNEDTSFYFKDTTVVSV